MISKNIQDLVENALNNCDKSKDNDNHLIAKIWYSKLEEPLRTDCLPLLKLIAEGKLPSFESVSRCRRKLQELHPDLRGDKYIERHLRQEEVKDDLQIMTAERTGINYETNTQINLL